MKREKIKWNKKYSSGGFQEHPSEIVKEFYSRAPTGRALDIAAGTGRNSFFLADKGFEVDAVDISEVGLGRIAGRNPKVNTICADFDEFDIPIKSYSLILNIRFLNRGLFTQIREGLIPGGLLIFEMCMEDPCEKNGRSISRDYLLRPNELLEAFFSFRILYYRESSFFSFRILYYRESSWDGGNNDYTASLVGLKKKA